MFAIVGHGWSGFAGSAVGVGHLGLLSDGESRRILGVEELEQHGIVQ
jgi:hypothetical protein